jgi:K+-transporting ATPase ATPase A chain
MKETLLQWILLIAAWVVMSRWVGTLLVWVLQVKQIPRWEEKLWQLMGFDPNETMEWSTYGKGLLQLNGVMALILFLSLKFQSLIPGHALGDLDWGVAWNLTMSFITQTNWQTVGLQAIVSPFGQAFGFGVIQFLGPATALSIAFALIRSLSEGGRLGSCWIDLGRILIYVLIPGAVLLGLLFMSQGVLQNFLHELPYIPFSAQLPAGVLPQGPVASFQAISLFGNNGGSVFGCNFAHPYANPTPWTDWLGACAMGALPGGLLYAFGHAIGVRAKGHMRLLWGLSLGLLVLSGFGLAALHHENLLHEARLGIPGSTLFATVSVATGTGANTCDFSTLAPLGQWILLFLMHCGQVIFGGGGVGFCNIFYLVLFAVFLGGLMLGKTPQYLGKKVDYPDMIWMAIGLLGTPLLVLMGVGIAIVMMPPTEIGNKSFTDLLYAVSSCVYNNGSNLAFAYPSPAYDWFFGGLMLLGRLTTLLPALVLAGHFQPKNTAPQTPNDLPVSGLWFAVLYAVLLFIPSALVYAPAWFMGPLSLKV